MKIHVSSRSISHFSYFNSIVRALIKRGHSVSVSFDTRWSKNADPRHVKMFAKKHPQFTWGFAPARKGANRKEMTEYRELLNYCSYLRRPEQSRFYLDRSRKYLSPTHQDMVRSTVGRMLLKSRAVRYLLPRYENTVPADHGIVNWLTKEKPDLLLVCPGNMRYSEQTEHMKAARQLGIPTAAVVYSWDNLTTKGMYHIPPDMFMVWNETQRREAAAIHGIAVDRTVIVGAPFFDKWRMPEEMDMEREAFLERAGLPAGKPFALYLGSSVNIAPDETWLLPLIKSAMQAHSDPMVRSAALLVRPHPANAAIYRAVNIDGVVVWPKDGVLAEDPESRADFSNSVRHSLATISINTSAMIDALILGKPCISIMPQQYEATQSQAQHFQHLLTAGVLHLATTPDDAADRMAEILQADATAVARARFIKEFVWPCGSNARAGEVATRAIELFMAGKPCRRIERLIAAA